MAKDAKKKKRSHKDSETNDDLACPGKECDSDSKDRRKTLKKKKRKDVETICQDNEVVTKRKKHKHCDVEASGDVLEEIPFVKKKKKHRKSKHETEPEASDVETNESTSSVVLSKRKKHKKHKKSVAEESVNEPELCAGREQDNDGEGLNDNSVVHKKKSKNRLGDGSVNEAKHTKVKKHKHEKGDDDGISNVAVVNGVEEKRKKKKSKVEPVQLDDSPVDSKFKTSKQKKRDKNLELLATSESNGDEVVPIEKKNKQHVENSDECAKVCDKSARQELSETLDTKQSKEASTDGATSRFLGQWGTAELDTGERQNKFLRLLGGFKASSSQKASPGRHCVNSALNASGENQLNKTLETQFDSAMNYRVNMQRGGGLGYSAPPGENKKFHIDSTSSKSIKFDD